MLWRIDGRCVQGCGYYKFMLIVFCIYLRITSDRLSVYMRRLAEAQFTSA
jgi:hypothetical protein